MRAHRRLFLCRALGLNFSWGASMMLFIHTHTHNALRTAIPIIDLVECWCRSGDRRPPAALFISPQLGPMAWAWSRPWRGAWGRRAPAIYGTLLNGETVTLVARAGLGVTAGSMNDPKEDMPVAEAGPVELFEPEPELATEQSAATEAATAGPGEAADELDEDEQETGPEDSVEAEAADAPAAAVDASAADEPSDSAETGAPAPEEPVGEALITAEASAREPETAEEEAPANAADEEEAETGSVAASDEEAGEADVLMAQQAESRDAEAAVASVFAEPESEHREPDPEVEGGSLAPEAPRDAELPMAESAEPKAAAAAVAAISAEKIESEHLESAGAEVREHCTICGGTRWGKVAWRE